MNNGLGISFFRYVKTEDGEHWSQVFARVPFDEVELKQKGALFGVVRSEFTESWPDKDIEMTTWIEERFNSSESNGGLAEFYRSFLEKFPLYESVWAWVYSENGKRLVKMVGKGSGFFLLSRSEKEVDMSIAANSGKVLTGEMKVGDVLGFGIGDVDSKILVSGEDSSSLSDKSHGAFKVIAEDAVLEAVEEKKEEIEETVEAVAEPIVEEKQIKPLGLEEDLASDKYIGKQRWSDRLKSLLPTNFKLRVGTEEHKEKRKKLSLLLGVLFMSLLVVSITFGKINQNKIATEKKWLDFSQPIETVLNQAVDVSKLNNASAKKMVSDARASFNSQKANYLEDQKDKIAELEKKIEDVWVLVSGEKNSEVVEVVNFELIRSGISVNKISKAERDTFSVIGLEQGLVLSAVIASKDIKVVAGKGAGLGWLDSVSDGKKTYVMTKSGIFEVGNESGSLAFDTSVTNPVSLAKFGANLYVLEKGNKEVFKYTIGESAFGERTRWLKEDQVLAAAPLDMSIDVDIWVLEEGGLLERFRRGAKEPFSLTGIPEGLMLEKVSVEEEGDRIALLAPKQATVLICSKETGVCDKQLKNEKLSSSQDIVFGSSGEIFVLFPVSIGVLN